MSKINKKNYPLILFLCIFFPSSIFAGVTAPDFTLSDLTGRTVSLNSLLKEGKPVVLSFFATWCESCLKEIADMPSIIGKSGALVYFVSVDTDKNKIEEFVTKYKITYPVLWDPKAATLGRQYNLMRGAFLIIPKTVIIAPIGTLAFTAESYNEKNKAALTEALAQLSSTKWEKLNEVAIYFTGSANGYLASCNCYKHPYGGYIKLLSLLDSQAPQYSNRILLDSGDFLPYGVTSVQSSRILKAISMVGYDAIALGDQDLFYSDLADKSEKLGLPFLASNIQLQNKVLWGTDKIIVIGKTKFRIISFLTPESSSLYPEIFTKELRFKDLKEVLLAGKKADYLILLSHAGMEENKKIAAEFAQIDLIVAGHSQELIKNPVKIANTLIVQSGGNLQNVGRLILRFDAKTELLNYSHDLFPLTNNIPDSQKIKALTQ